MKECFFVRRSKIMKLLDYIKKGLISYGIILYSCMLLIVCDLSLYVFLKMIIWLFSLILKKIDVYHLPMHDINSWALCSLAFFLTIIFNGTLLALYRRFLLHANKSYQRFFSIVDKICDTLTRSLGLTLIAGLLVNGIDLKKEIVVGQMFSWNIMIPVYMIFVTYASFITSRRIERFFNNSEELSKNQHKGTYRIKQHKV